MTLKPLKDFVLVAENKKSATTDSGIILESADGYGDTKTGVVLAVGPKVDSLEVGDNVLVQWNKAQVVTVDGNQRIMIKQEDIIAVLEDE